MVYTNIFRNLESRFSGRRLKTAEEGAATSCYLATNPSLVGVSGYYLADCNPEEPAALMQDSEMARRLWAVSEELVEDYLT